MQLQLSRGLALAAPSVVDWVAIRLPQVAATFLSLPGEVLQARPRGCKQAVVQARAAVAAERAAVVQERVAAVPLPQIAALLSCNATAAATSETTALQRLLHQGLMSHRPRYPSRR